MYPFRKVLLAFIYSSRNDSERDFIYRVQQGHHQTQTLDKKGREGVITKLQDLNQNIILEEKEGKIFDVLRDKPLKVESGIKFYGDQASTEDIYE